MFGVTTILGTGRRGKERSLSIPKQLPPKLFGCPAGGNSRWLDIACGREHTATVTSDGSLFTWSLIFGLYFLHFWYPCFCGAEFGQLGDGTESARKHPKKVKQLQSEFVISVSCGAHCISSIAEPCENDGTMSARRLWVWGQNQGPNYPRLFWGAFAPSTLYLGLGSMGQLGHCSLQSGDKELLPRHVVALDGIFIKEVACGGVHSCAVTAKGAFMLGVEVRLGNWDLGP